MASFNYQDYQKEVSANNGANQNQKPRVGFFDLKGDGEEAIVRFIYSNPNEFNLFTVHHIQIDGKWRNVDCLDTPYQSGQCPLCQINKAQRRFFIKLIQYIRDENGNIQAVPRIWERSDRYADTLNSLITEYGDISECIFKIKRNGAKGDLKTSYDIMYANPSIYKAEIYNKDLSLFEGFDFSKFFVLSKTQEEMQSIVDGSPAKEPTQTNTPPSVPTQPLNNNNYTQPPQQPNYEAQNQQNYNVDSNNFNNFDPNRPRRTYTY